MDARDCKKKEKAFLIEAENTQMDQTMHWWPKILNTKLMMVEPFKTFKRKRVIDRLGEILHKKIVLVTAGAGWGKTTLIAQAIAKAEGEKVWYRLDESDNDFATFMRYLIAGIQKCQPQFGTGLQALLTPSPMLQKIRERLLLEFLAEIENGVSHHLIIVLDDFHLIHDNPIIASSMDFLLRLGPANLHWIVASRTEPALQLSRYRASLEVIDLGELDLAFRRDEIAALFSEILKTPLTEEIPQKLLDKTGGWAAGLILYYNSLQTNPSAAGDERLLDVNHSEKLIFQYLEENIFSSLPDEVKEFMLRSSLLLRLDPEFCDKLFGGDNSRKILETLCNNHLFTSPCGDEAHLFEYHRLMQDFLTHRLERTVGGEKVKELHHSIGRLMENMGNLPGAMNHYLQGEKFEDLSRLIRSMMFTDLLDCPLPFLSKIFEYMPIDLIEKDSKLLYVWAKLTSLKGELDIAVQGFQRALERFRKDDDAMGVVNCVKDLGFHYYLTGNVRRAKEEMWKLYGKPHEDPFFPMEVGGCLVLFASIMGKMEEADCYYASLKKSLAGNAGQTGNKLFSAWLDLCYSNCLHHSGNFDKAHALNVQNLKIFNQLGMEKFLPLANFQAALTSFYRTSPEQGYRYAQDGLSAAIRAGITDHQYAWLLYARALNSPDTNEAESAISTAYEALDIFSNQKNAWGQACTLDLLGMIHRRTSELAEAEAIIRKGLVVTEGLGLMVTEGALALRLAEVLIVKEDLGDARIILDQYRREIDVSKFHKFISFVLQSRILYELGEDEQTLQAVRSCLQLARANNYLAWIARELSWMTPILIRCHAEGIMRRYIEAIFAGLDEKKRDVLFSLRKSKDTRIRCAADGLIAALPKNPTPSLEIYCLGQFKVLVEGISIPPEQWRNSAAQKIFKYMALRHNHGFISKEVLLELVWPGEDPEKTMGRLHVALNALRKMLEPWLKRGDGSAYILRHRDSYHLKIGETGSVDVQQFHKMLALAENSEKQGKNESLAGYLKVEALYGGPLFAEDPYEEWFMTEREMLQEKYLALLRKIIDLYEKEGAWKECTGYAEKYLVIDPYAEPVYCALMRFHFQCRQTAHIMKTFKRCKALIQDDLGCPISNGTIALYNSLIDQSTVMNTSHITPQQFGRSGLSDI